MFYDGLNVSFSWSYSSVDKCFVPSDALNICAQDRNLKSSQIIQYGLPIRKGFWSTESLPTDKISRKEMSKETLREELNLETDLPTVLVVGGKSIVANGAGVNFNWYRVEEPA